MDQRGRLLGDRYRLESVLATGGMGRVWRAQDTLLQRPVAVKVLRAELTADPSLLGRFRAEAQHAARLNHPSIAAVHDYGETVDPVSGAPVAYLVLELVPGESLSDLLARVRRLDVPMALRIVRQTADALSAAHAAGVVHRDVKPGNVLITPVGDVKITDFGIARSASSVQLTRTGEVIGTPHYLAPEQAQGAEATPASDVYSLGVVAYECLCGRRPFEAENSVQVAAMQIREAPPPLPMGIPEDVRRLVERAMAKDPATRFPDGAAFRDAVDALGSPAIATRQETMVLPSAAAPATAVLPRVEAATAPANAPAAPHVSGAAGAPGARPWLIVAGSALLTLVVLVVLLGVFGSGEESAAATAAPASSAPSSESAGPTAVEVAAGELVGRPLVEVQTRLTAQGLRVHPRTIATGDVPAGQVIAVDPVGPVAPGGSVTVTYAVAPAVQADGEDGNGDGNARGNGRGNGRGVGEDD
ncbi:serine/threonine protein kinase [Geodermatophilus sp. URMC 64]